MENGTRSRTGRLNLPIGATILRKRQWSSTRSRGLGPICAADVASSQVVFQTGWVVCVRRTDPRARGCRRGLEPGPRTMRLSPRMCPTCVSPQEQLLRRCPLDFVSCSSIFFLAWSRACVGPRPWFVSHTTHPALGRGFRSRARGSRGCAPSPRGTRFHAAPQKHARLGARATFGRGRDADLRSACDGRRHVLPHCPRADVGAVCGPWGGRARRLPLSGVSDVGRRRRARFVPVSPHTGPCDGDVPSPRVCRIKVTQSRADPGSASLE